MATDQVAERLQRIAPSATIAATQKARELKAKGVNVISLGAGEPDFDTPEHVKEAAIEAIRRGETKYTAVDGMPELKDAICKKFARDNALDYRMDEVSVSPGGKPVIFNAFMATLNPGDEVIIPAPYWVSYPDMAKMVGGEPVIVETSEADGFLLSPEALDAAITDRTKWLILNSPSNPTGGAYSRAALEGLAEVLRRHPHVMVLSDDIYEHVIYDDFQFHAFASVAADLKDRTLTMNGASKAYAMTGWRIGFSAGPAWLIKAMAKVMSQSTSNPTSISQWATVAALNGDHSFLKERNAAFKERRDMVVAMLNDADGLHCATPPGAFYVFPSCKETTGKITKTGTVLKSDEDFTAALLEEQAVAAVFGAAFGAPGYFRISYAAALDQLREACERIQVFCASLK
ncbi:MAG: pyridoxal phosphate-dependent aminotransferase [Pseudomonadota bacterium]